MTVLIKGLKMPRDGERLKVWVCANGQVIVDKRTYYEEYEAVELPDHGDLIDRDALINRLSERALELATRYGGQDDYVECLNEICEGLEYVPVVIPAERSEE